MGSPHPVKDNMLIAIQCQEKPRNEPFAVLLRQPAVVVQVLLQVGECSLNLVVRIWHPLAVLTLVGEEVWKVEVQTVHRCSQPLVRIVHLAVLMETLVAYRVLPLFFPFLVILLEVCLISLVQPAHQFLQFFGS